MNKIPTFDLMLSYVTSAEAILCFIAGLLAGVFYFLGLWWTIGKLPKVQRKKSFLFYSFFVRIFLFLIVMLLIADKNPVRLILFFLGFILSRIFMLRQQRKRFVDKGVGQK